MFEERRPGCYTQPEPFFMFAIVAVAFSSLLEEFSDSVGRTEAQKKAEGVYSLAWLNLFWATVIFVLVALVRNSFVFSVSSLPTFILRLVLEIIQAHITVVALIKADRSTFSFLRIGTIPLLFIVDQLLGYPMSLLQMIGIAVILISLSVLIFDHDLNRRGLGAVVVSTVLAVVTLSLYKYNITKFNSVEAEQGLVSLALLVYFMIGARLREGRNPFRLLKRRLFMAQSLGTGIAAVVLSFTYLYAAPSVITTARRSFSALWSTLSGRFVFHERRFAHKAIALVFVVVGLVLLAA